MGREVTVPVIGWIPLSEAQKGGLQTSGPREKQRLGGESSALIKARKLPSLTLEPSSGQRR